MIKDKWQKLNVEEKNTLGLVKSGVILHLISILNSLDKESKEMVSRRSFSLGFKAGKNLRRQLICKKGVIHIEDKLSLPRDITLKGKTCGDIGAMLTKQKAKIIPIPGSFKFLKAGKTFSQLAGRIAEYLGGEQGKKNPELQVKLMLEVALMGVVQVGRYDKYVQARLPKMGKGVIEVEVLDRVDMARFIQVENGSFSLLSSNEGKEVTAKLIFQDQQVVRSLLSGKIRAMSALGDGRIKIRGRLPMIQGLFPLLDRFSFFMKVK